jgi:hypothetical protein
LYCRRVLRGNCAADEGNYFRPEQMDEYQDCDCGSDVFLLLVSKLLHGLVSFGGI